MSRSGGLERFGRDAPRTRTAGGNGLQCGNRRDGDAGACPVTMRTAQGGFQVIIGLRMAGIDRLLGYRGGTCKGRHVVAGRYEAADQEQQAEQSRKKARSRMSRRKPLLPLDPVHGNLCTVATTPGC